MPCHSVLPPSNQCHLDSSAKIAFHSYNRILVKHLGPSSGNPVFTSSIFSISFLVTYLSWYWISLLCIHWSFSPSTCYSVFDLVYHACCFLWNVIGWGMPRGGQILRIWNLGLPRFSPSQSSTVLLGLCCQKHFWSSPSCVSNPSKVLLFLQSDVNSLLWSLS